MIQSLLSLDLSFYQQNRKMMVIGSGMLATAFMYDKINSDNVIIFASGVSNSLETDKLAFNREVDLLLNHASTSARLVYFSTVSIFDPSLSDSPYVLHKLYIEEMISAHFKNYLIIRLPIVVGKSTNPNTLTNFLYNCIRSGKSFNLYTNAQRYLIDLDDVVFLTSQLLQKVHENCKINLVLDNKTSIQSIVYLLAEIIGRQPYFNEVPRGSDYDIDNTFVKDLLGEDYFQIQGSEYIEKLLKKYYQS